MAGQRSSARKLRAELSCVRAELADMHMQHLSSSNRLEAALGAQQQEALCLAGQLEEARELLGLRQAQLEAADRKGREMGVSGGGGGEGQGDDGEHEGSRVERVEGEGGGGRDVKQATILWPPHLLTPHTLPSSPPLALPSA